MTSRACLNGPHNRIHIYTKANSIVLVNAKISLFQDIDIDKRIKLDAENILMEHIQRVKPVLDLKIRNEYSNGIELGRNEDISNAEEFIESLNSVSLEIKAVSDQG